MTIYLHLDSEKERVTNLSVANAILEMCADNKIDILNPRLIAKAILLALESEGADDDNNHL